ncbi:MAG: type II secretion system minor pseudopilin GspK [Gammaproteobacteria bacterium]|nr:type II secretion system minor pseudopilin GspK [Gammaproteobacteria bacterium]MDH5801892.1 type II secretion system minor pseudopilin GspK [Gammaproteobacteria bacterium]
MMGKSIRLRQQGVALITAILVVALATIAAVAIHNKQQLNMRRTENLVHADQAYLYTLGGEQWASQFLLKDTDMQVDHGAEDWATPLPPIPVEGGSISGFITDASSGFPINTLVDATGAKSPFHVKVFQQLSEQIFENNPGVANLLVDWLDNNSDVTLGVGGNGAEDTDYQNLQRHPFRAANRPVSSVSELMLILRMSEDAANLRNDYAAMFPKSGPPLVNALPGDATININSASQVLLTSMVLAVTDVDQTMAQDIVAKVITKRDEEAKDFKGLKDLTVLLDELNGQLQNKLKNPDTNPTGALQDVHKQDIEALKKLLSTGSKYYLVQSQAKIGRMEMTLMSLVKRDQNKVTTLRRGLGTL